MALKPKVPNVVPPASLPAAFAERVRRAFSLQAIRDKYKAAYDDERVWLDDYIKSNDDGITLTVSKAFKVAEGTITMKQRTDYTIDTEAVAKMIASGELSLATVLNIASINALKLQACIGEARFAAIATTKPSEPFVELKANADFKAEMERTFHGAAIAPASPLPPIVGKKSPAAEAPKGVRGNRATADLGDSLAKAKAAAETIVENAEAKKANFAATVGIVESDLDAILGGK